MRLALQGRIISNEYTSPLAAIVIAAIPFLANASETPDVTIKPGECLFKESNAVRYRCVVAIRDDQALISHESINGDARSIMELSEGDLIEGAFIEGRHCSARLTKMDRKEGYVRFTWECRKDNRD